MKEILLQLLENSALSYSKGFDRWKYLWQEKTTFEQQAELMASELEKMGYKLLKTIEDEKRKCN